MIYMSDRKNKNEILASVYAFLDNNDITNIPNGHHEIEGEDFFVNIFEYDTKNDIDCIWEAHRQYYDVHYVISGEEIVKIGPVEADKIEFYDDDKDYVALTANVQSQVLCRMGNLLFLDENDAHLTGTMIDGHSSHVRKAVFKIRIK